MVAEYKKIVVENHFDDQATRIILNSPPGNILDGEMMDEIARELSQLRGKAQLKIIVFEGAGKHFCFGASVAEHRRESAAGMLERFHGLFYAMIELGVPTASIVRGQCLGGGMELVLYCDFVFAEMTAVFGQPEIKLGVLPPPASIILPLRSGQAVADQLVLTGETIDVRRAFDLGLVTYLVPEGKDGWQFASAWIEEVILPKSAVSLRHARSCVRMHSTEDSKCLPR